MSARKKAARRTRAGSGRAKAAPGAEPANPARAPAKSERASAEPAGGSTAVLGRVARASSKKAAGRSGAIAAPRAPVVKANAADRLQALNRATLARQMLLARERVTVDAALERLVALQAQLPRPPYIGLWTRLATFRREDLTRLIAARRVVRAPSLRGTLHLMRSADYLAFQPTLEPALVESAFRLMRGRVQGIDLEAVKSEARAFFADGPRDFEALREALGKRRSTADVRAMAYLARMSVPLAQTPSEAAWGYASAPLFALAEAWIGAPVARKADPAALVTRYLAAFGPGGATDVSTWSGLSPATVRDALESLRPKLAVVADERKREVFDLADAPRPDATAEAPVRFLPEFDNLLLSHADRRRFVADAHRRAVFLPGLRVAATFLVDGFVAGTWSVARKGAEAALDVVPFAALGRPVREALEREGEALLHFVEPEAARVAVRITRS